MPQFVLIILAFSLVTFAPFIAFAQDAPPLVWGQPPRADLALRYYPADPSAPALVLGDEMTVGFWLSSNSSSIRLRAEQHRRVKYFERLAYRKNPVRIEWYPPLEAITQLQARLYLPNGQLVKLRKRDFRADSAGGGWMRYTLALDDVPAGAVLEYRYRLRSESFDRLPPFYFQEQYPVRRKAYRATVPEWFQYAALAEPAGPFITDRRVDTYTVNMPVPGTGGRAFASVSEVYVAAESVPPVPAEPYTENTFDYVPHFDLRLESITWPRDTAQRLYPTWPQLADSLRADTTFGGRYLARDSVATVVRALAPVLTPTRDTLQWARLAYRALAERLTWDGTYAARATRSPDAVWAARTGTSAELNLTLLAVLRELGIPAYPVLVGTRGSGVPTEQLARFEQFDHVLVVAQIGEGALYLDLDGTFRPAGLPRPEALNNRGWLVTDAGQTWIDLRPPPSEQVVAAELVLDTTGLARGRLSAKMTGYYAAFARERLAQDSAAERGPLLAALRTYYPATEPLGRTVEAQDSIATTLRIDLDCRLPLGQRADDGMSLYPVLLPALEAALATAPPRQFPLDMPFPWSEQFLLFLDLPAGYTVETLPEPVQLRSPDGRVFFDYSVRQDGRQLVLQYRLTVGQSFYSATAYEAAIRDIFTAAIDRQNSAITLQPTVNR